MDLLYLIVSFFASVAGAICGIGGGVIIKPTLDMFHLASVPTISFLSGCTVLSMSCYSVGRTMLAGDCTVRLNTATPLAIGAAVGGILGKELFTLSASLFASANKIGAVQSFLLLLITLGTVVYTLKKDRVHTLHTTGSLSCILIGLALGIISSFLGIGGGPINLVVLFYFFSMDTKTAAQNSLYIILFSQIASLFSTLLTHTVPKFTMLSLILMVCGGISGGIVGRILFRRLKHTAVEKLFISIMVIIIGISCLNVYQYAFGVYILR